MSAWDRAINGDGDTLADAAVAALERIADALEQANARPAPAQRAPAPAGARCPNCGESDGHMPGCVRKGA